MIKLICDKCGSEITDTLELQEAYTISLVGGYNSVFGDGARVRCDLCQHCLYGLIVPYYKVEGEDDEAPQSRKETDDG